MLKKTNKRRAAKKSPRKPGSQALGDALDVQEARRILQRMKATGEKPIPWSQVKKELGL